MQVSGLSIYGFSHTLGRNIAKLSVILAASGIALVVGLSFLPSSPVGTASRDAGRIVSAKTQEEFLVAAKTGAANKDWRDALDAISHLSAQNAALPEIKRIQKSASAGLAESVRQDILAESRAKVDTRKLFAKTTEKAYLSQGMDVYISVSGVDATTIKMKYVLIGRPAAYKLSNDSRLIGNLRNMGFRKMILTDGYDDTWTIDLT
jgi:hypothetical protein